MAFGVFPIVGTSGLISIDLGLRGAVVALCLLIASIALRDRRDSTAALLGAALAIGAAASMICTSPTFPRPYAWWGLLLLALSSANCVVFWLWARSAFDDDFVPRPWHGALWVAVAVAQWLDASGITQSAALERAIERALSLAFLGLALLAVAQTLLTWRGDLVQGRRRLRLVVLIGASAQIVLNSYLSFLQPSTHTFSMSSVANAFALFVLVGLSAWSVLEAQKGSILLPAGNVPLVAPAKTSDDPSKPAVIEPALLRRLERLMTVERIYRREGLTIGLLSAELRVPEYRMRQLINEGLGYRNFNAFLNHYRISEAKEALADPEQVEVPVLTIAMDTGFQSIGPFNRAFRAETDMTPTEFRRLAMAGNAALGTADQKSASRVEESASRIAEIGEKESKTF
ncbi:AraC family transcriptional regulator [Bradyrhizobium guangdongense]|uniref:helix-turn-helix domain-containing protein n=1 Tax=Bradyrhizobium guangdongense TaxID=1325090 RepID=UPI00112EAD47|nr:AraC family transcriptional regulator [Bradyrhizobium guangdongense]TPQ31957.1 AraC family transcriptional regulator [Bradyrhizobium guangdongense]